MKVLGWFTSPRDTVSLVSLEANYTFISYDVNDSRIASGRGYLDELAPADLGGVVVVGEGDAQLASVHGHSGLRGKRHRKRVESRSWRLTPCPVARLLRPTLNFFPPMVSMSLSWPMVKVLVTLASLG